MSAGKTWPRNVIEKLVQGLTINIIRNQKIKHKLLFCFTFFNNLIRNLDSNLCMRRTNFSKKGTQYSLQGNCEKNTGIIFYV